MRGLQAKTLAVATQPIGKIHPYSNIAETFESLMIFGQCRKAMGMKRVSHSLNELTTTLFVEPPWLFPGLLDTDWTTQKYFHWQNMANNIKYNMFVVYYILLNSLFYYWKVSNLNEIFHKIRPYFLYILQNSLNRF